MLKEFEYKMTEFTIEQILQEPEVQITQGKIYDVPITPKSNK
jgi:hypothetical protein